MQPQFRFPRSTVFLMLLILAGVTLTIAEATKVAGDTLGSGWRTLIFVLVFMLLSTCAVAAVVCGILYNLRRGDIHRLQNGHN